MLMLVRDIHLAYTTSVEARIPLAGQLAGAAANEIHLPVTGAEG